MAREVLLLAPDEARVVPWKNGRGVTHELALWPPNANFERGEFDWRISKAVVESSGEFSVFPDHERILVVTAGGGLMLTHEDSERSVRVRPLDPYSFDGAWRTHAELARGSVSDFNVLTRRGVVRADVAALQLGLRRARETLPAGHAFAHVLSGELVARVIGEEDPFELAAGDSLWLSELAAEEDVEFTGRSRDCTLLLTRLEIEPD
ncbi:MAG: HutD family protein [Planctomycetes bacterium]|nr:HutD family protein [Planctomycetota bacterium]